MLAASQHACMTAAARPSPACWCLGQSWNVSPANLAGATLMPPLAVRCCCMQHLRHQGMDIRACTEMRTSFLRTFSGVQAFIDRCGCLAQLTCFYTYMPRRRASCPQYLPISLWFVCMPIPHHLRALHVCVKAFPKGKKRERDAFLASIVARSSTPPMHVCRATALPSTPTLSAYLRLVT